MDRTKKILAQLIEDLDLAIIKAKAQLEYVGGENEKK